MPQVNFNRPELVKVRPQYTLIADALAGSLVVKSKGGLYLPSPESVDTNEGRLRYAAYKTRAVFYNVTKRTEQGLLGQLFSKPPEITVPDYLQNTVADMDGSGMNATQQTKRTAGHTVAFGRAGLLSDFPTLPDGQEATAADVQSGRIASTITRYDAQQIINWRYHSDYAAKKLLFVILEEKREIYKDNDFSFTYGKQWRVCRLDASGLYVQELYFDNKSDPVVTSRPTDYNGNRLDYIPFEFIGSEDNDPEIDEPPLFALADINMAHYRNSADFEDSTYLVGQPTIAITGLDQNWVKNVMGGEKIRFGSRNAIPLPAGADMKLVQADPNSLAKEGMDQKERQMVALGAKLVEQRSVQRTATEANQEESAEASVLMTVADNTSVAYAQAFASCARFYTGDDPKITFKLNTSFEVTTMDPNARAQTIKEWQMGAIAYEEMRQVMRRAGIATLPDDQAKAKALEEEQQRAALLNAALAEPTDTSLNEGA